MTRRLVCDDTPVFVKILYIKERRRNFAGDTLPGSPALRCLIHILHIQRVHMYISDNRYMNLGWQRDRVDFLFPSMHFETCFWTSFLSRGSESCGGMEPGEPREKSCSTCRSVYTAVLVTSVGFMRRRMTCESHKYIFTPQIGRCHAHMVCTMANSSCKCFQE